MDNFADFALLAAAVSGFAVTCAFGYWGGEVKAMLVELRDMSKDHENRIRSLEKR